MSKKAPDANAAATGTAWLAALEARVRDAGARLREQAEDNARLTRRVADLEKRLAAAEQAANAAGAAAPAAAPAADGAAWREEREEIRRRVERLSDSLESLLEG